MNANKQDAGGLPELPDPLKEVEVFCDEWGYGTHDAHDHYYTADQMRAYGELCRAAPAGGDVCATCQGHGMIGWHTGQTPEQFDQHEAPCPDCSAPAGSGEVLTNHGIRALDRCCNELRQIIDEAPGFDFDEMTVQALQTAIESMELRKSTALLRKLQQGAHTGKVVAHRLHTPGGKWQWIDGEPSLGTLDLWKSYGWTLEYAYAASQGQEGGTNG